jgi:16S rRNA (guanine527-N7)-methyltransferase
VTDGGIDSDGAAVTDGGMDNDRAAVTDGRTATDGGVERGSAGDTGVVVAPPPVAAVLFGDRLPLAERYAALLATDGMIRGLIGPREAPRIWDRHLVNCAVIAEIIPSGASVADIGSGAGLPGIVLGVARPDLQITLVEPLARRVAFLTEVVAELGLTQVRVLRARAEECVGDLPPASVVTARAVAPLDRLAAWCLPIAEVGGKLLALKGASAAEEVAEHRNAISRIGGGTPVIHECGVGLVEPPVTVVEVVRERIVAGPRSRKKGRDRGGR